MFRQADHELEREYSGYGGAKVGRAKETRLRVRVRVGVRVRVRVSLDEGDNRHDDKGMRAGNGKASSFLRCTVLLYRHGGNNYSRSCDPMLEVSTRSRRFPVSALAILIRRTPSAPLATEARGTRTRASGPSGPFQTEEGPFIHYFHV